MFLKLEIIATYDFSEIKENLIYDSSGIKDYNTYQTLRGGGFLTFRSTLLFWF